LIHTSEKIVVTGLVTPVCAAFEGRFLAAGAEVLEEGVLRCLVADFSKKTTRVIECPLSGDLRVHVVRCAPRTGVIQGSFFSGFVAKQTSRDGNFVLARKPQQEAGFLAWMSQNGISYPVQEAYKNDEMWDELYLAERLKAVQSNKDFSI
jgi:hypothetical protein